MSALDLTSTYLHLTGDTNVDELPVGPDFWQTIHERTELHCGRLVVVSTFEADWQTWEVHPLGEEVVTLLEGAIEFLLEEDGDVRRVRLDQVGQTVIVPRGAWHTADVSERSRALFITPGEGTQHRPR